MYSPKINESLVRRLYEIAKERKIYMTTLTNSLIADGLAQYDSDSKGKSSSKQSSYNQTKIKK